jgi:hypothetical protein
MSPAPPSARRAATTASKTLTVPREGQRQGQTRQPGAVPGLEKYHGQDIFLTEALTLEAKAHVSDAVKEQKPFFLYFAQYAVHAPFDSDPRFRRQLREQRQVLPRRRPSPPSSKAWTSRSATSSIISTPSASPTTRSSSSSATTAAMRRSVTSTRWPAPLRCAAKRARITKAACACPSSPLGESRTPATSIKSACPSPRNADPEPAGRRV